MLIYPNVMTVPIMDDPGPYGLPPPPRGTLHIIVVRANGLRNNLLHSINILDRMDPYVRLEVRMARPYVTRPLGLLHCYTSASLDS